MSETVAQVKNLSITVDPKVKTAEQARDTILSFAKNPPQNPLDFVKFAADFTGASASLTGALTSIVPGAAFALPALSAIFSLFGGGGPSIGELTLTAIKDLGTQVVKIAEQLKSALTAEIQASAEKVINVVLLGETELARQQSAAIVFANTIQADILDEVAVQKNELYADFLAQSQALQNDAMSQLGQMLQQAQASVDAEFQKQLSQIISLIVSLSGELLAFFNSYLAEASTPAAAPVLSSRSPGDSGASLGAPGSPAADGNQGILWLSAAGAILFFLMRKKS